MKKSLRFSLLCLFTLLAGSMAAETTVTFIPAETMPTAEETSVSKDGITLKVSGGLMNGDLNYRTYKGQTLTVSSTIGKITKITLTSTVDDPTEKYGAGYSEWSTGSFTANGSEGVWTGEADEVVLTAGDHQVRATVYTVTVDGDQVNPQPQPTEVQLYAENFTTDQGKFTIEDKSLPEGLDYVWVQDSRYGMKATAYLGGENLAAESWLVSPVIDLTKATETSISFSHALNFFADLDHAKDEATVWVKIGNADWTKLDGVTYPETFSWTFVDSKISTPACDGKKVQFAFRYKSTAEKAGTWEVKNFVLKGQGEAKVEGEDQPEEVKTVSTTEALALIAQLADGKSTSENYYVTGVVVGIEEISVDYGNATFTIADNATDGADKQLKVFRAKGLNNEKIDDPEIIEVGNNVVIFGKLQKYVKDDVVTPEVSSCYIYSINAQSGIKGLTASERPTLLYNLNGQKVDAGYRGIVVKNGKKVLMK